MKAVILYRSKTGTTKKYAEEALTYVKNKGIEVDLYPIHSYPEEILQGIDYLFLGCWTSGLFLFMQHPDKEWIEFAKKLPESIKAKIALFTTYKLLTGSMFKNMTKYLKCIANPIDLKLKSKDGKLTETNKAEIDKFLA